MEHLADTDLHRGEPPMESKLLPPVFPVSNTNSPSDEAAHEVNDRTANVIKLASDEEIDNKAPTLGSPFCSPKPRVKDNENYMSSKDNQNNVPLADIQHDMSLDDGNQLVSPMNGDTTNKNPIVIEHSANAKGIPAVSTSSDNSFDTLVPTPEGFQKLVANVTATMVTKQDIGQNSPIVKEDVDQDLPNVRKEDNHQDTAVGTNEDMDRDPTIITKEDIEQGTAKAVNKTTEPDATVVQHGTNTSDNDTEPPTESVPPTKANHSVPPHMRPDFQPPVARQYGFREARQTMPIPDGPRVLEVQRPSRREYYGHNIQNLSSYRGGDSDREQVARLSAQLMKTQNELNAERKRTVHLRTTIEAEQQVKTEAALSTMLNDLLQKQIETFTQAVKNDALVRDMQFREQKAAQLEIFLAEGQKQFSYELDARGLRPLSAIEREEVKRATELALRKDIADTEAKLSAQLEGLQLREAMQLMREQQYKALIRASLEQELKVSVAVPQPQNATLASAKAAEIAEFEYNNGYAAGKAVAQRVAQEEVRKKAWGEGYAACHRALKAIADLRAGRVEVGSPELAFLWDAGHEGNLFGVGVKVGRNEVVSSQQGVAKGVGKVMLKAKADVEGTTKEEVRAEANEKDEEEEIEAEQQELTHHAPAKNCASTPAPPTFASQLRGKQAMHNGHVVLAGCSEKQKEELIDLMG